MSKTRTNEAIQMEGSDYLVELVTFQALNEFITSHSHKYTKWKNLPL